MFVDTHCHLDFPPLLSHVDKVLTAARRAHLNAILVPAVNVASFDAIATLTDRYTMVYGAFGLHPLFAHSDSALDELDEALTRRSSRIVAVGEIGLDKMIGTSIESQLLLLDAQLHLAKKYHLPVILHSRKTHDILYSHLKQADLAYGGVVHAFAGSYQQAIHFIDLGYVLGVGGTITYLRAHKTRETLSRVPLNALVLETDAPDMPLCGFQGQSNQPAQTADVFQALCRLRSESPEDIRQQLILNTQRVFGIPY